MEPIRDSVLEEIFDTKHRSKLRIESVRFTISLKLRTVRKKSKSSVSRRATENDFHRNGRVLVNWGSPVSHASSLNDTFQNNPVHATQQDYQHTPIIHWQLGNANISTCVARFPSARCENITCAPEVGLRFDSG